MKHLLTIFALCSILGASAAAQTDILGTHNLQGGGVNGSPITGNLPACLFCHAPHSNKTGAQGLWSQTLSTVSNYTLPSGTANSMTQPVAGSVSNECLSCHDGTVAPGQTTPYGNITMKGAMTSCGTPPAPGCVSDVFGTDLSGVHPFNFAKVPLQQQDAISDLYPGLLVGGSGTTANPAVKLINQNVQCTSCHEPHNQFIDTATNMFLVVNNSSSALCQACHIPPPTSGSTMARSSIRAASRTSNTGVSIRESLQNGLNDWKLSAHAMGSQKTKRGTVVGRYNTVSRNGCSSCHAEHSGAKGSSLLIQSQANGALSLDQNTRNCVTCHDGSDTISPTLPNILAEFNKPGHPLPVNGNTHQTGENGVLNGNRHATCVDCHNPHASKQANSYSMTTLRPSQNGATGVSESDGTTLLRPAQYQYQTCLRCHGNSSGKAVLAQFGYAPNFAVSSGDPLNELAQFGQTARSSHPVMHDRNSGLQQPSLLVNLKNLDGRTPGRPMGNRILCSDCHNSDDSRESGGQGPSGPHGSYYPHILERRYEMSQVAPAGGAGSLIQNLFPNPSLDASCSSKPCVSPYALCAKCHDLTKLSLPGSFSEHARHINDGFSCSVCHTAHGVVSTATVSGERLVNFDVNVVGSYKGEPITYNRGTNSCNLMCHNHAHTGKLAATATRQTGTGR